MEAEPVNQAIAQRIKVIEEEMISLSPEDALRKIWRSSQELEKSIKEKALIIEVAGNIGAGKSTTAYFIGLHAKIPILEEHVEDNQLLARYYDNMAKYSERLQLHLIDDRAFRIVNYILKNPTQSFCSDRSRSEDPDIFCEALCNQGFLSLDSKEYCQWYFEWVSKKWEKEYNVNLTPNLIVFVKPDIETGWKRILSRSRGMEVREDAKKGTGITREFYEALQKEYEKFPERLEQHYPGLVLTLAAGKIEISDATGIKGQLYVVESVKEALKIAYNS
ncbi:deoxynucleoside kinase [Candidatus Woesearchaeota archaeon]|nr:deoxynucleoside kinase [Candidatus Woesearchaeota archaeon]